MLPPTTLDPAVEVARYREEILSKVGSNLDAAGLALLRKTCARPAQRRLPSSAPSPPRSIRAQSGRQHVLVEHVQGQLGIEASQPDRTFGDDRLSPSLLAVSAPT